MQTTSHSCLTNPINQSINQHCAVPVAHVSCLFGDKHLHMFLTMGPRATYSLVIRLIGSGMSADG